MTRHHWIRTAAFVALLAAGLPACGGPSWEEIRGAGEAAFEARRAEAEGRIALLRQVAQTVDLEVARDPVPPINWGERPAPDFGARLGFPSETGNAGLLSFEQLTGTATHPRDSIDRAESKGITFLAPWLETPRRLLDGQIIEVVTGEDTVETARENVNRAFDRLMEIRYVLVLRTHRMFVGEVTELTRAAFDRETEGSAGTFESGGFLGDILLFDVTDGEFLGGAKIVAGNSETVEIRGDAGFLKDDLASNVRKAIEAAWGDASGN
jgi:hypothetical protein